MTLSYDMLTHAAIGAALALFLAKQLGWLRLPGRVSVAPAPPTVVYATPHAADAKGGPKYEATVNVPHKITIEPQVNP